MTEPSSRPVDSARAAIHDEPVVRIEGVSFAFDDHIVLRDVSFTVDRGRMVILLGASGSGKSILLKLVLGLFKPDAGEIVVKGHRVDTMRERDLLALRGEIGMLFQETALFDSLTVSENVGYRLFEETDMARDEARARVNEVLGFIGLAEYSDRMPSELSGGQRRRVAIARAMASKPSLLLFDDPTVGLDPIIATTVDDEVVKLRDLEEVTSIVVTHQIRDAFYVATHQATRTNGAVRIEPTDAERARFLVLHDGQIVFDGSGEALRASRDARLEPFMYLTLPPW